MTSRALPGASARRERLSRERTASQLRRQARLEAEVVEQLEPLLGPAGRPVGETAMTLWRRRRVDAYLSLSPLQRARRTWVSWGRVRRAATVLALAPLWTVVCLPLRMVSLASLEVSHAGVAALALAAPIAAFVPPRSRRGRFVDPLPEPRPPWRGSRAAATGARLLALGAIVALVAVALLAALGPGAASPPEGRVTPAARHADVVTVRRVVAEACGAVPVAVEPVTLHRYAARMAGGGTLTVAITGGTGFAATGDRAQLEGGAAACPAP